MNRLKDKRALITGGTSGIGLETARQSVQEGARVAITGTNPKTIEAAGGELGENVLIIASDASDVPAQKMVAETMRQSFGGLDVLFLMPARLTCGRSNSEMKQALTIRWR